jgi:hypothetical protein
MAAAAAPVLMISLASVVLLPFASAGPIGALASGSASASVDTSNPCGPPVVNPVACENTLPGSPPSGPNGWDIGAQPGDLSIQGFATDASVDVGQTVSFKIKTDSSAYHLDIYRVGWYGGDGARLIAGDVNPSAALP